MTRDAADEEVRRHGERLARLAHAAEVDRGQDHDEPDRDLDAVRVEHRQRGDDVVDTGGHRDGDGHDVVDEQRRRHDQAGLLAEVLVRHLVVAAAGRVRLDELAVGQHHHDQQHDDGCGDPGRERQECEPADEQDHQEFLRRVRHGGEGVAREDRERKPLGEQLPLELVGREWIADQPTFWRPDFVSHEWRHYSFLRAPRLQSRARTEAARLAVDPRGRAAGRARAGRDHRGADPGAPEPGFVEPGAAAPRSGRRLRRRRATTAASARSRSPTEDGGEPDTSALTVGEHLVVSGSGYDPSRGIYVAICVIPADPATKPGPCIGGVPDQAEQEVAEGTDPVRAQQLDQRRLGVEAVRRSQLRRPRRRHLHRLPRGRRSGRRRVRLPRGRLRASTRATTTPHPSDRVQDLHIPVAFG